MRKVVWTRQFLLAMLAVEMATLVLPLIDLSTGGRWSGWILGARER